MYYDRVTAVMYGESTGCWWRQSAHASTAATTSHVTVFTSSSRDNRADKLVKTSCWRRRLGRSQMCEKWNKIKHLETVAVDSVYQRIVALQTCSKVVFYCWFARTAIK